MYFNYKEIGNKLGLTNFLYDKKKLLRVAIITLLILATLFLFFFQTGNKREQMTVSGAKKSTTEQTSAIADKDIIVVDVAGAVKKPSVIELSDDSRVEDAINAAGGLADDADITQINRAAVVADGEKIFIPTEASSSEAKSDSGTSTKTTQSSGETKSVVNINTADSNELQNVPGIGPATAEKILQFRSENGLFRKLEDLKKVSGIGDKTYEKMKPYIGI